MCIVESKHLHENEKRASMSKASMRYCRSDTTKNVLFVVVGVSWTVD